MSNELRLLKAFIKAQGYEIEHKYSYDGNGNMLQEVNYEVTKKLKGSRPKNSEYTVKFLQFWTNYPRKEKQPNAFSAFNNLSGKQQNDAIIDCKTRYNGVENKKYIPLPASYLNAHSFNDDPLPNQKEFTKEQKEARRQELKKEDWARVPDSLEFKVVVDWAERHGYSRPVQGITILGYKSSLNNQIKARTEREI